jgi:hypothetical protein
MSTRRGFFTDFRRLLQHLPRVAVLIDKARQKLSGNTTMKAALRLST